MKKSILLILMLFLGINIYSQEIDFGADHQVFACNGNVYTYGYNNFGQMGSGTVNYVLTGLTQALIANNQYIEKVKANTNSTYAISNSGEIWAWGRNDAGQLGLGNTQNTATPIKIKDITGTGFLTHIVDLSANNDRAVALNSNGEVLEWGYINSTSKLLPEYVLKQNGQKLTNIVKITTGVSTNFAIDSNGNVWAWGGQDYSGSLGLGITTSYNTTVAIQISGLKNIVDINSGAWHTLALDSSGFVWAWGNNFHGSIGQGFSGGAFYSPVQVKDQSGLNFLNNISTIGTSVASSYAKKNTGEVLAWGDNFYGQLGNSQIQNSANLPVAVTGINGVGTLQNVSEFFRYYWGGVVAKINDCEFVYIGNSSSNPLMGLTQNAVNTPRYLNFSDLPCCEGWGEIKNIVASEHTICPEECIDFEAELYYGESNTITWSFPGNSNTLAATGQTVNNVCYNNPGTYNVYAYENGSSTPSATTQITVLPHNHRRCNVVKNDDDQSMNRFSEKTTIINLNIYPNPSKSIFNIISKSDNQNSLIEFKVFDIYGNILVDNKTSKNEFQVDLSNHANGIYFLQAKSNDVVELIKLIKQ